MTVWTVGCVLAGWAVSTPAAAAGFTISPTRIDLSAETTSRLLTVKNDSDQVIRLQVSAFAWSQSPAGEIQLAPTTDVIFFPALVTLDPGAERRVRVGTTAHTAGVERTFRIFVEQLPPAGGPADAESGVRVLTKVGIPIFLQPARPAPQPALRDLAIRKSTFSFRLVNEGTAHFVPGELRVEARDGAGQAVLDRQLTGWYVLAGSHRLFEVALGEERCRDIRTVVVSAVVEDRTLTHAIETPHGTCGP